MVLSKPELIGTAQLEIHVLLHLISKLEPQMLDYRPTPKQRSTIELLKYLSIMGPGLIRAAKAGTFDPAVWTAAQQEAEARNFEQTVAAIAAQKDQYAQLLGDIADADFRGEIEMFGQRQTRGAFINRMVLGGHAAYRMQLFLYLKACGRADLSTMNLWAGVDAPAAAV